MSMSGSSLLIEAIHIRFNYHCSNRPPSHDMLISQRSLLQSELNTLREISRLIPANRQLAGQASNALKQRVNDTSERRRNATDSAVNARSDCLQRQTNNDTRECTQFQEAANAVINTTLENAGATADFFSTKFLLKTGRQYQSLLRSRIAALEREIPEINMQLDHLQDNQVYLGEIVELFKPLNETRENDFDNQWVQLYYDSDTTHFEPIKTIFNIRARGNPLFTQVERSFSNAKLKATGELLPVLIKRPWFKPTLFDNPMLDFVS